jgi:hypothetical protein
MQHYRDDFGGKASESVVASEWLRRAEIVHFPISRERSSDQALHRAVHTGSVRLTARLVAVGPAGSCRV